MQIKFTKNPTGKYNLAYSAGDEANLSDAQATLLIEEGFAVAVTTAAKQETAEETETAAMEHPAAETATAGPKKNGKK